MCFTETWFKQDSIAEITGYNSFHSCRNEDKIGGGVSIYIKLDFKSALLSDISFVSDVIETCSVKVAIGDESVYELGIYRPPDKARFDVILNDLMLF